MIEPEDYKATSPLIQYVREATAVLSSRLIKTRIMSLSKLLHGLLNFLSFTSDAPSATEAKLGGIEVSARGNCLTNVLYEGAPAGYMINVNNSMSAQNID